MYNNVGCCLERLQAFLLRFFVGVVESLRLVELADLRQYSGISDNSQPVHRVVQVTLAMPHTKLCQMNEVSSLQVLSKVRGLKFSNLCSLLLKKNSSGGGRRAHGEGENL